MRASAKFAAWSRHGATGVAITGASGWVGRAVTQAVIQAAEAQNDLQLRLFGSSERPLVIAGRGFPLAALGAAAPLDPHRDWLIVHLAVTGPDRERDPHRLRALNDDFLQSALRLAEGAKVRRFVSASSGAVHQFGGSPERHAYAQLKRDQETSVRDWAARTGTPLLLPRIFNLGGPYMNHAARYALGDMILQARAKGVIRIGAPQPVIRSYVHVLEFAQVTLELALSDEHETMFETAGQETVELAGLARAVGRSLGLDVSVERPAMTADGEDRYVGDGSAYRAALDALGADPVDLDRIIRDTDAWLAA